MLEGLAAWVLNSYIGEYVENLNTQQLSIGVFQGEVELENLPLRRDALRKLDLPLEVKSGFIGKIRLTIPVKKLRSAPWVITLDKLYLVAGPIAKRQYNEDAEKEQDEARKQAQLKALDEKWKLRSGEPAVSPTGGSWWAYSSLSGLGANILENLQLHVKDVHIRYEDDVTVSGSSFACGVTIKSLVADSTDGSWVPRFVSRYDADMMHKLVELEGFSSYWDLDTVLVGHLPRAEMEDALQRPMNQTASSGDFKEHDYLLAPVTAQARMRRNTTALPLRSPRTPRIQLDIELEKIPVSLSEKQYRGLVAWMKEFSRHEKARKYRKWRPNCSVRESPGQWWRFAIESQLHYISDRNRRRSQDFLLRRARDNVLYVKAYTESLTAPGGKLDSSLAAHMGHVESALTFEEIKILREAARGRITQLKSSAHSPESSTPPEVSPETEMTSSRESQSEAVPAQQPPIAGDAAAVSTRSQGVLRGWFPGWSGWYGGGGTSSQPAAATPSLLEDQSPTGPEGEDQDIESAKAELEQELLDVLSDAGEDNTLLRRDAVFAQLNFSLESAVVKLVADTDGRAAAPRTLLELECSAIKMTLESRPRTNGLKFNVSVGGLYLRDRMTVDSIMPVLVAPQQKERLTSYSRQPLGGVMGSMTLSGAGRPTSFLQPGALLTGGVTTQAGQTQPPLFQLTYEKKPVQLKADYRLEILTNPLDIVYNPSTISRVKDFFTINTTASAAMKAELEIAAVARSRYEAIKQQTQEELRNTLDDLLESEDKIKAKRWNFNLDVAAPQIIIPHDFKDPNATLVVFDLGHLQFKNMTAGISEELKSDEDDEDDFVTPSSTPPNETQNVSLGERDGAENEADKPPAASFSTIFNEDLSEAAIRDKIYDKYTVNLSEVQVLVGKGKDNWRFAHNKGTSHLHVVDKFSISLQLDRRLLYTSDPQWPKITLAGTLPCLTLHVNESKIQALRCCADLISPNSDEPGGKSPAGARPSGSPTGDTEVGGGAAGAEGGPEGAEDVAADSSLYLSMYQTYNKSVMSLAETEDEKTKQAVAESRLLLAQFSVNQVSLEIQSRGRSVAELQVAGVRANFSKRPFDTSFSFSVHSLLVVDALQTFGQDFELLVASHKDLCLDSRSGSIHESNPSSPISPQSPRSPSSPAEPVKPSPGGLGGSGGLKGSFHHVQAAVSSALQGLVTPTPSGYPSGDALGPGSPQGGPGVSRPPPPRRLSGLSPFLPVADTEALIKVELDVISASNTTNGERLHLANVQFNNLDFIANQQTIVELLGFFKRVLPSSGVKKRNMSRATSVDRPFGDVDPADTDTQTVGGRWEVTADFHRLNVLLMRVEGKEYDLIGRKVATATLSEAKVQATLAGGFQMEGYLGGLQLQNLTAEGRRHQKVLSVGLDPQSLPVALQHVAWQGDMYTTALDSPLFTDSQAEKALTFTLSKGAVADPSPASEAAASPLQSPLRMPSRLPPGEEDPGAVVTALRMASVWYTHSPAFLKELSLCVTEFTDYVGRLGSSLKYAAAEMAMGLVNTRPDLLAMSLYDSNLSLDNTAGGGGAGGSGWGRSRRPPSLSELGGQPSCEGLGQSFEDPPEESRPLNVRLDAVLQTPVIVLPRTATSSEVLVAHLGRISLRNFDHPRQESLFHDSFTAREADADNKLFVEIRDMSMYSVDLDAQPRGTLGRHLDPHGILGGSGAWGSAGSAVPGAFSTPRPGGGGVFDALHGVPILHNTVIELTVSKQSGDSGGGDGFINEIPVAGREFPSPSLCGQPVPDVLQITGKVVNPLKVALSKQVYEQILKTLDNITPELEITKSRDAGFAGEASSLPLIVEEGEGSAIQPSVSALNLGDLLRPASIPRTTPSDHSISDPANQDETPTVIKAFFELPVLNIEMTGDLGEGQQGLVDLRLSEFKVKFEKADPWTKDIEICLQSLVMEDLLQNAQSTHRHLMVSHATAHARGGWPSEDVDARYMSHSCPSSMIDVVLPSLPPSLPSSFHRENVFSVHAGKPIKQQADRDRRGGGSGGGGGGRCPMTPPPSLQDSRRASLGDDDMLVHIKLTLVDKQSPHFQSKYNSTSRFVDVDFNCLDTTVNLQTWVCLLDFLGLGAKVHDPDQFTAEAQAQRAEWDSPSPDTASKGVAQAEVVNTEVELRVQSLTLILNKPEYELARANVSGLDTAVSLRDGHFAAKGQLRSISLLDQSPHGKLYRERFITTGNQALDFDFHKYGLPDPDLLLDHDISLKLQMTSVWYVHTQRFIQETLAFCQHFNQLQDYLGRMRAATAGKKITEKAFRGSRIALDIEAGAPVILIPHSSRSTDILVMNMGTLSVHNSFKLAGTPGTISQRRQGRTPSAATAAPREAAPREAAPREAASPGAATARTPRTDSLASDTFFSCLGSESESGRLPPALCSTPTSKSGSYHTAPLAPSSGGSLLTQDSMTGSIYGSLDSDWRSDDLEHTASVYGESLADTASLASDSYRSLPPGPRSSTSLGSFYSAIGGGPASDISSAIGPDHRTSAGGTKGPRGESRPSDPWPGLDLTEPDPGINTCLLDVMDLRLNDIDLYSAEWTSKDKHEALDATQAMVFPSYAVVRESGNVLKERCRLTLQVERNLEGDLSHAVPDFSIDGKLTSLHFLLDVKQYKLVRGLLVHNFGEELEEFQKPLMSQLQDPKIHTVLSGDVWKGISICLDLDGVITELLVNHLDTSIDCPETSLARFEFNKSRLTFESYSDGCKDVDLVSHEIRVHDTRYRDDPVNVRPNKFCDILKPSKDRSNPDALQMEVHFRSTKDFSRFTVLLNNMRIMGVFDWILTVKDFLLTGPDDPFKQPVVTQSEGDPNSPQLIRRQTSAPVLVSGGVMTKRTPVVQKRDTPFELRLNVTDTELVLVEDSKDRDTNAVILKSTAVLSLRPHHVERPLSCSLQSLEVFSCSLGCEDDTALSIIDPMIITMELNASPITKQRTFGPGGLLDATATADDNPPILEISFSALNIRLSYNDLKLFMAIVNSMPRQLLEASNHAATDQPPRNAKSAWAVSRLEALGFARSDCEKALHMSSDRLEDAAMWLTQHAVPAPQKAVQDARKPGFFISGYEVKAESICLCLIDDCLDADVPLAELTFSSVRLLHRVHSPGHGHAVFQLNGDYYNRGLSGWEPFIESWKCSFKWSQGNGIESNKVHVELTANETLNLNVTSALLEQYNKTKVKWTEDYYRKQDTSGYNSRKRVPFIPFAIRNQTGGPLRFATMTSSPFRLQQETYGRDQSATCVWHHVPPDTEMPFLIDEREKMRHKHTHELKVHQMRVAVEGWEEVTPVSMDKVGTYFRSAQPSPQRPNLVAPLSPARVVFDVAIEGSARKVITVRSALVIDNRLEDDVEVLLQDAHFATPNKGHVMKVPSMTKVAVPLRLVHSKVWLRPQGWSLDWCSKPILWQHVGRPGQYNDSIRACDTLASERATYRFCVSVSRQGYPAGVGPASSPQTLQGGPVLTPPGHLITLMPPVRVENLLPIELTYMLKAASYQPVRSTVKAGKLASLYQVDLSQTMELGVFIENFPTCKELVIPPGTVDYKVKLKLYDPQDRLLELYVRIKAELGGSLRLSVYAPYWLVNRSGLPLIFKQDGCPTAAGQFDEHELARSVTPLLFSYADKERSFMCTMRLGKSVHGAMTSPHWCHRFSLERGIGVRQLHVVPSESRPDWVYNIGIEVRQGRGRYHDINIVTFSPRFQLDNRSRHKLAFAQRHIIKSPRGGEYLSALPSSTLSFHWPRLDLDQLLCVRLMDVTPCDWSGGFKIEKVDSFHINMRGEDSKCHFLRVDILLQGATFYIVFSDTDTMPPPYRIDNFSEVPIMYYQTKVTDEKLRTFIKPRTSLAYAWDEPMLPAHITLKVQGGTCSTYDMNSVADGDQLSYENFIYIAFSGTFRAPPGTPSHAVSGLGSLRTYQEYQELVLDVEPPNRVVLKKKEAGKRSQLWRMTTLGMMQHEGSSAPRDPRKPASPAQIYVLDIKDIALQPSREVPLTIRKPDERRRSSQLWRFTEDGRLCCKNANLAVQSKDGPFGLRAGEEAVLGPSPATIHPPQTVPREMAVHVQRLRPGSGLLSVKVITDGPTRVLQIMDIRNQQYRSRSARSDWVVVDETYRRPELDSADQQLEDAADKPRPLEVLVNLTSGLGLSLINSVPEEMVYVSLKNILVDYSSSSLGQALEVTVKDFQVDNQLLGVFSPTLLYVTPSRQGTDWEEGPALQVSLHKVANDKWNADIYKHLIVSVKKCTLRIEETLLWKLLEFSGFNQGDSGMENLDESSFDSQRAVMAATSAHLRRYYFGAMKVSWGDVNLSMITASELPPRLKAIKKALGISLVMFEDASVELDPFIRYHPFETRAFLLEAVQHHFTEELKSQAAKILGSVDFLGNPLGLVNDISEGVSGLLEGNVGGLFKNLTHGMSNTAAKMVGSLSDVMVVASMDEEHQKQRQQTRQRSTGRGGSAHLKTGMMGLGQGLLGGLTSIVSQTYTGIAEDGFPGLFTGLGKGVVGTVTKPVAGVLDFASGAASAVRESSRSSSRKQPSRVRRPRCVIGPGGLLPAYSKSHASYQQHLYLMNDSNYSEMFIALEQLRSNTRDTLQVLISSEQVFFLGHKQPSSDNIVLQISYEDLYKCGNIFVDGKYYLQLTMKVDSEMGVYHSEDRKKQPQVRCESESIAQRVAQQIMYAKNMYEETKQTLAPEVERGADSWPGTPGSRHSTP